MKPKAIRYILWTPLLLVAVILLGAQAWIGLGNLSRPTNSIDLIVLATDGSPASSVTVVCVPRTWRFIIPLPFAPGQWLGRGSEQSAVTDSGGRCAFVFRSDFLQLARLSRGGVAYRVDAMEDFTSTRHHKQEVNFIEGVQWIYYAAPTKHTSQLFISPL